MKTSRSAQTELIAIRPPPRPVVPGMSVLAEGPRIDIGAAGAFRSALGRKFRTPGVLEGEETPDRMLLVHLEGMMAKGREERIESSFHLSEAAWSGCVAEMLMLSFIAGLADPEQAVRANSASGLAGLAACGSGIARAALERSLEDQDVAVRRNSTSALMIHLAASGDEQGMEGLINHADGDIRGAARRILLHMSIS